MTSFPLTTKVLHWLIALHMLGLTALGYWMVDLTYYSQWYNLAPWLHKMFGVLVFALALLLLIVRSVKGSPAPLDNHTPLEKRASKIAHWTLFAAVVTIPISGYIFTTATGDGIDLFGIATLPALFPVSDTIRDLAIDFHIYASYGLLAVIAAHAGGALKHHFVDRDRTLKRMTVG
ncbi:MAG: cytochrome b [Ahrensia sp.]|nr:cytochrome b [Ahrensia sp.]